MNIIAIAEQTRRALQMFANTLDDAQALEIAAVYDTWKPGRAYAKGEIFSYGTNAVGDPQLYRTAQGHNSQADWPPDLTPALYTPIGLDDEGNTVWSQPTGAHDAYNTGDVVNYNGVLYESLIDGNTTVPGTDSRYWAAV